MKKDYFSSTLMKMDYSFDKIGKYRSDDGEIDSYLAKYLCIISSGFVEDSIRYIFGRFSENKSHIHVSNYVNDRLYYFQNAKADEIDKLTYSFSKEWGHKLEDFFTDEMKDSINTIVNNKNLIAHGKNSGITYRDMKKHWANSIKLVKFLKSLCES